MTCRICNSEEHFAARCPQGKGGGKGSGLPSATFHVAESRQAAGRLTWPGMNPDTEVDGPLALLVRDLGTNAHHVFMAAHEQMPMEVDPFGSSRPMGPTIGRQTDEAELIWRIVLLGLIGPSADAYRSSIGSVNSQHVGYCIHRARYPITDAVGQSESGYCSPAGHPGNSAECPRSTDGRKASSPCRKRRSTDATDSTVGPDASRTIGYQRKCSITCCTVEPAGCWQADCRAASSAQHYPYDVRYHTTDA
jgi:hypothetical protein